LKRREGGRATGGGDKNSFPLLCQVPLVVPSQVNTYLIKFCTLMQPTNWLIITCEVPLLDIIRWRIPLFASPCAL
jgi:hypothetical protein